MGSLYILNTYHQVGIPFHRKSIPNVHSSSAIKAVVMFVSQGNGLATEAAPIRLGTQLRPSQVY
jgi:hypothetical protein